MVGGEEKEANLHVLLSGRGALFLFYNPIDCLLPGGHLVHRRMTFPSLSAQKLERHSVFFFIL